MELNEITEELKAVILNTYGDRVGTFKLESVDEETSKARQKARGQLSKEQRLTIDRALVPFRDWLIERDPEAAERVANGSPAPQDIETAVRAAEDHAVAKVAPDISSEEIALLLYRLENGRIETIEERNKNKRPPLRLSNRHVRTMAAGFAIIFLGSGVAGLAAEAGTLVTVAGAAVFVYGFRRWRSGETTSNVPDVSVFRGGKIKNEGRTSI
ncbi:MAG TPA: hypothetical protein DCX77_03580 [Acidimicrobiaceae bacterium]|nr:hypothetical protein [Acidimicrobiaceae bacterium]|tara:strand:+ start:2269 stop:2907 length:639 start_codon:yes stop_codon:yes gene_type:complete